jgi:hypothetical protein
MLASILRSLRIPVVPMPEVAKLPRTLLTDEEVRRIAEKFKQVMGEPMSGRWEGRTQTGLINLIDPPPSCEEAT